MQTTRLDLPIRGMTCASCVARIEQGLRNVPGVAKASVNLATERATLRYDAAQVGVEALVTTIRDLSVVTNSLRLRRFRIQVAEE